jgi:uncharacterized protein
VIQDARPTYLLDVNVLLALFDPTHIHHDVAHEWFGSVESARWATCPITENGFVRVLSNPAYAGRRTTVADAVGRLDQFTKSEAHDFWGDDVSIRDVARVDRTQLTGHREITDAYLLALAVHNSGVFATFDRGVRVGAVAGAERRHLEVLGPDSP